MSSINTVENLVFLYHTMRASENLLTVAASRSEGKLKEYFERHREEERDHADWLAEDLKSVGVDVKRTRIPQAACEMVGTVYYMIHHVDPCALLGYMDVLESWDNNEAKLKAMGKGYPPELLRTMRWHAEHDKEHIKEVRAEIEELSPEQRKLVEQTKEMTRYYFGKGCLQMVKSEAA
jgi:rubrerythrin